METSAGGNTVATGTYDEHFQVAGKAAFKDVESITVESVESVMNRTFLESAHTELTATVAPLMFSVVLASPNSIFSLHQTTTKANQTAVVTDKTEKEFDWFFRDQGTANRVADAMRQAVKLCGGSN